MIPGIVASSLAAGGITFVGSDQDRQGNNTTDLDLVLPTVAADDFAIAVLHQDDIIGTQSIAEAGWTTLRHDLATNGDDTHASIFYKKLDGTETTCTLEVTDNEAHSGIVAVFRGVDTVTPFDATEILRTRNNDSTPAGDAITTVTDNAVVIVVHCGSGNSLTAQDVPPDYTTIEHVDRSTALLSMGYRHTTTAGSYAHGSWQHTSAEETMDSALYTLALRPA